MLPARTQRSLAADAARLGVESGFVCIKILTDHYDQSLSASALSDASSNRFNVNEAFRDYPPQTKKLTQRFVDEVIKMPGVQAFKKNRSIVFSPRFVHVDYPISSRGDTPGLVTSFYGKLDQFFDPRGLLKPARNSYMRARITNDEDLDYCIPFIAEAYERRFGKRGAE